MIGVMEVENKRKKRAIREEAEQDKRERFKKLKEGEGGSDAAVVVPSEEEVDEFFAILRRMKEAVKYFDERGKGGREWREALEQAEVTLDDGEDADDVAGDGDVALPLMKEKEEEDEEEVIINNDVFDLNAVAPEAAESGGA